MLINYLRKINLVTIFIVWRLILFIPLIAGVYLLIPNITVDFTYIYNPFSWKVSFHTIFLFPWANFDGIHYINIAQYGYINQARFFPLFPVLISILATPISAVLSSPLLQFFVSLLFVNVIFFIALWIFKKLIELDFSKKISNKSILSLLIFPTSFFFVCIYSEGLFLLLALLSFYLARKKMWFWSIVCAMFLMTTRFVGIAVLPALLYEYFTSEEFLRVTIRGGFNLYKKSALFLIAPLGLIAYSIYNYYKWHNFLDFIQAQGELGNNRSVSQIVLFPQTIYRYIKILSTVSIGYEWGIALLELVSFLLVAFLLYFAWKKQIRVSYLIFALINFAIATATGTFSGLPRYILILFPVFVALGLIKNKLFWIVYTTVSPILLFILLMLFSRGYFVA